MLKKLIIIAMLLLALPGCDQRNKTGAMGSEVWTEAPKLTYGVLESEALSKEAWSSGRTEETSEFRMCETELGFYMLCWDRLYYADKATPDRWLPVCGDADCSHKSNREGCTAILYTDRLTVRDGRLFFAADLAYYPHLYSGKASGMGLFSAAPDGSDLRLEYSCEEGLLQDGGFVGECLTARYWLYMACKMDSEGQYRTSLYVKDENGTHVQMENLETEQLQMLIPYGTLNGINGVELFQLNCVSKDPFYIEKGSLASVALPDRQLDGAYLDGNTVRYFAPGDGYYDYNLESGLETKLASPRLENSGAELLLPNLIVESTLLGANNPVDWADGTEHRMEVFDGAAWHSVALPEALRNAPEELRIVPLAVTSDAVWFSARETDQESAKTVLGLYRVSFENWKLERFAAIPQI